MPGRRGKLRAVRATGEVAKAISGMTDDDIMCRDFGHSWRPYTAEWLGQRRQYLETLACTRCGSARRRLLDEFGALMGNSYAYRDGYLVHGIGRLTGDDRDAVRLAGLQAVMRATDTAPPKSLRGVG